MSNEDKKSTIEMAIFLEFVERQRLPIDPSSAEKRYPPEPDILCRHLDGSSVAFELAEICNNDLARESNRPTGRSFWTRSRLPNILSNKLAKRYQTNYPIELLLYLDGRDILPDDVIIPEIEARVSGVNRSDIRFRRIWLLGQKQTYLVCDFV